MELLGCSIETFHQHIENQFSEGMNWNNRHLWDLDHIKPISLFDLSDPQQQKECFNYKNIQPLWREDNMKKGSKYYE